MTREPSPPKLPRAPTTAPPKMPRQRTSHPLLDFYNPGINSTDENGCTLAEMMGWEDSLLERRQDYIRWLFPLPEESMLIHNTPAVNREVVDQFRNSDVLKHKMIMSFLKMINFYGFTISPYPEGDSAKDRKQKTRQYKIVNPPTTAGSSATQPFTLPPLPVMGYYVVRGPNWKTASRNWCTHIDHNHLRITRILRSLRIFGIQNQSEALYDALKRAYRDPKTKIGKNSMMFWRRAVRNELHIGPGGERIPWLKEEVERPPVAPAVGEGTGDATDETKDETKDKKEDNTDETKDETKDKKEDKKEEPEVEAEKADRQL
ncbi:hypothetical protein P280DRAFT_397427 [Massarina eburnea CBS 473.64]|uniref:Opioid growth factor receptor (OGFr) conserved domain-containing protein n=1 Tax=Massarina eburnea CBS 473.64 TaxID=1395130 RepID=A0A6A6S3M3_9PLEO|nr:hypothetical protein P280DRAFT_397427 [Massarina eburnea CBS 473.64]